VRSKNSLLIVGNFSPKALNIILNLAPAMYFKRIKLDKEPGFLPKYIRRFTDVWISKELHDKYQQYIELLSFKKKFVVILTEEEFKEAKIPDYLDAAVIYNGLQAIVGTQLFSYLKI
jgi:hypothetical protein